MLKTVYQHTMSQKSEQVAEMVDTFFSYSPSRFMNSVLRYWLPYIGLKFQRKGSNLRTDYARKSGGRSPRLYPHTIWL